MNLKEAAQQIGSVSLIVDVGANVGGFYREAKALWPQAEFLLIEGNSECSEILSSLMVPWENSLLSDSVKEVDFWRRRGSPACTGCSIYREQTVFYEGENAVPVRAVTTTLDATMQQRGLLNRLGILLKLDVQGAELDVLRGGSLALAKTKAVICEVAHTNYNLGAPMEPEVTAYLAEHGFDLIANLQVIVHPIKRHHIQSDYLYMKVR